MTGTEGSCCPCPCLYRDDDDDGQEDIVLYKSIVSSSFVPPGELSNDKSQPFQTLFHPLRLEMIKMISTISLISIMSMMMRKQITTLLELLSPCVCLIFITRIIIMMALRILNMTTKKISNDKSQLSS